MKSKIKKPISNLTAHRSHNLIKRKRGRISPLKNIVRQKENSFELCNMCKKLGYCKADRHLMEGVFFTDETKDSRLISFNLSNLSNLINHKTYGYGIHTYHRGKFSSKNIRLANEAFQEEEYETAYNHFKAVADELGDEEAMRGGAISLFYMERYSESVAAIEKCNENMLPEGMKDAFIYTAILRQKQKEIGEKSMYKLESKEFLGSSQLGSGICIHY